MGFNFAILHLSGNAQVLMDKLINSEIGLHISSAPSLRNFAPILSSPIDFLSSSSFNRNKIYSEVVTVKLCCLFLKLCMTLNQGTMD